VTNMLNYMRGWVGRADWRVLAVSQLQSWIVMGALMLLAYAAGYGWWWGYLIAAVLIAVEVPLGVAFMSNWRFDVHRYMRVVDGSRAGG
jgi:hypothetical protein